MGRTYLETLENIGSICCTSLESGAIQKTATRLDRDI